MSYWVVFSKGTVIVFDNITKGENIKEKAIKYMKEFDDNILEVILKPELKSEEKELIK